ncbi:hypothetical protein Tco_0858107 [Tanacetum coccineum]|uniref:Uncharacterized protein n=1 Tax=Tanacetum coccineum TaxID=301880 RepID=A0ABQ5B8D1_9ASTR
MSSYNHFGCSYCGGPFNGGNCPSCSSVGSGNEFVYDPNPYSYNETPNFFNQPPQHQYETYSCEFCGGYSHPGFDCQTGNTPVFDQGPCYNQDFGFNQPLHYSPSQPQQLLVCENCGGPHATFQCQPMNQNFNYSNSFGFDQIQPPQQFDNHQPQEIPEDIPFFDSETKNELYKMMEDFTERMNQELCKQEALLAAQREQELLAQKQAAQEKEKPPNSDFHQLIEEMCGTKVCEEQKKKMEDTMLELLEDCRQKALLSMHNDVEDLIESTLNSKLLLIKLNSQHLNKEEQEVKNIAEPTAKRQTRITPYEVIKSSVENLVPIPSEFEGISDDTCDMPVCEDSSTFDALKDHSEILSDDGTSSDDEDFKDIEYVEASPPDSELVSLEEVNVVDQEKEEIDLEDILQIQDVILREKFLNINRLITNIESLNDNSTPDREIKSPSLFPIPIEDSDFFFEKSDTSLSYLDNSLPEFKTFSYHTEETSSGSTTTHANNFLPKYDSFHFEIEPDQDGLTSVVMEDILGEPRVHVPNMLPTHPTHMMDSDVII